MTNEQRACMAFICGVKANAVLYKNIIHDYTLHKDCFFVVYEWETDNIRIYDMERNCIIQGESTLFFNFHDGGYTSIEWEDKNFTGFDYKSQSHYMGLVQDNLIQIFDYETSQYYLYELK